MPNPNDPPQGPFDSYLGSDEHVIEGLFDEPLEPYTPPPPVDFQGVQTDTD